MLKQDFGTLELMLSDFKLGKSDEETLTESSLAQLNKCSLVISSGSRVISLVLLKVGGLHEARRHWVDVNKLLKYYPALFQIALPLLKL